MNKVCGHRLPEFWGGGPCGRPAVKASVYWAPSGAPRLDALLCGHHRSFLVGAFTVPASLWPMSGEELLAWEVLSS